jgi:hypothetical protein
MRPRLKDDVHYVRCSQGVYLHSDHGSHVIPGAGAYAWLDRLAPYLTGTHTLDELISLLPVDKRATVESLVRLLHQHGFVSDARTDRPHSLTAEEEREYAGEIAFIRYALDSAEHRFQRYREARLVLQGSGPVLVELLRAGLTTGWRDVRVRTGQPDAAVLHALVDRVRRDPRQRVVVESELSDVAFDEEDVVLHVSTEGEEIELLTMAERAASSGCVLGQVLVARHEAWFSPVGRAPSAAGWRRLLAWPTATTHGMSSLTGPVPGVLASRLALAQFRHSTGLDERPPTPGIPDGPVLTRVDLHTLETRRHFFLPHPMDRPVDPVTEAEARTVFEELLRGEPVDAEELLTRATEAADSRTGLLGAVDELDFVQFPLCVCRATFADPFELLPAWAPPPTVVGHGIERDEARLKAVLGAFAGYGALAIDRRRLTATADGAMTWGIDLTTGKPRSVPVKAAFPVLANRPAIYRPPVGAAAGLDWAAALETGLRQHCEDILARRLSGEAVPRLDLHGWPLQDRGAHLLRLVATVAEPVAHDLGGILSVPACALRIGQDTVLATGTTLAEAVTAALERGLLSWQSRTEGQPAYAPDTVAAVRAEREAATEPPLSTWDLSGWEGLTAALRATGPRPVAVPLHHDPQATGLLPYLVHVVLMDD